MNPNSEIRVCCIWHDLQRFLVGEKAPRRPVTMSSLTAFLPLASLPPRQGVASLELYFLAAHIAGAMGSQKLTGSENTVLCHNSGSSGLSHVRVDIVSLIL